MEKSIIIFHNLSQNQHLHQYNFSGDSMNTSWATKTALSWLISSIMESSWPRMEYFFHSFSKMGKPWEPGSELGKKIRWFSPLKSSHDIQWTWKRLNRKLWDIPTSLDTTSMRYYDFKYYLRGFDNFSYATICTVLQNVLSLLDLIYSTLSQTHPLDQFQLEWE